MGVWTTKLNTVQLVGPPFATHVATIPIYNRGPLAFSRGPERENTSNTITQLQPLQIHRIQECSGI